MTSSGTTQPRLFDDDSMTESESEGRVGTYVLSSNWSIGPLLARGCLLPPCYGELTEVPFFDERYPDTLVVSHGPVPFEWCNELRASRRNAFPIAIAILGSLAVSKAKAKGGQWKSVSLSDVDALIFQNEKDKKQFLSMSFADFDVEKLGISITVDSGAFEVEKSALTEGKAKNSSSKRTRRKKAADEVEPDSPHSSDGATPDFEVARELLAQLDADAALRTALVSQGLGRGTWIESLSCFDDEDSAPASDESAWISAIRRGLWSRNDQQEDSLEMAVLAATACVVSSKYRLDAGWPATEVLEHIETETRRRCAEDALEKEEALFETWAKRTRAVLAAQVEPPGLLDEKSVCLRAVLLLLLRGELEPILDSKAANNEQTVVKIGPVVRLLAICLASVRTGLRSLPTDLKVFSHSTNPRVWLSYMGDRILKRVDPTYPKKAQSDAGFHATYREMGVLRGEWILSLGKEELVRRPRDADPGLIRIDAMGRDLGYVFEEKDENCLRTAVPSRNGGSRFVYVALHRAPPRSIAFLRFWSPALDVSPKSSSAKAKWPTPALNKRSKKFFIDLLERNAQTDLNCRFALSRDEQAVVVLVDQMLATLDEEEFRQHVEHVATVADAYAIEM